MESSSMASSPSTSNTQECEGPQTTSSDIDDEQGVIDKSRDVYQRTAWNKLHVSIGYLVCKVNAVNIGTVKKELFQQNIIRGKHMFCQFVIEAQLNSTTDTHVYATLVAVINPILPEIGELILKTCIMQFNSAYFESDISNCSSSVMFIGHLINHGVADEKLAVELLGIFLNDANIFSIKIAIVILEICGKKISEVDKDILNKVFQKYFNMLDHFNNEDLDEEDKNCLKTILELQENGFKFQQLDLVPANECQITHFITLNLVVDNAPNTISYQYDPEFEFNEKLYKNLILKSQGYDSEEENEFESATDFNNEYDGEKNLIKAMKHINNLENDKNVISLRKLCLRKLINFTELMMDYKELVQKIVKNCQVDMDLCHMIMDCCCEHATYLNHFGHLTEEFSETYKSFADMVEIVFIHTYVTWDQFDLHRQQIISSYFAHLSHLGLIPFKLSAILKEDTLFYQNFVEEFWNIHD